MQFVRVPRRWFECVAPSIVLALRLICGRNIPMKENWEYFQQRHWTHWYPVITGHYQNPGLVFTDYMGFAVFNENLLNHNVRIKSKSQEVLTWKLKEYVLQTHMTKKYSWMLMQIEKTCKRWKKLNWLWLRD